MYTLFETLFLSNEMRQKYNFCCVWSIRHWKNMETRSSFFMCFNKHGGETTIRWTYVLTEVLLESGECCWNSTTLEDWIWYAITNKGNNRLIKIRDKFEVDGTMQDVFEGRWGRKRSSTDNESADAVMQVFARSTKKSLRQCSHEIGIEKSSVHRILNKPSIIFH